MIVNCFTYMFSIVTARSSLLNFSTGLFLMSLENKYDISTKMSMDIHTAHERGKDKWSSLVPLTHHAPNNLWINLFSKEIENPFVDFKNLIVNFPLCTWSQNRLLKCNIG